MMHIAVVLYYDAKASEMKIWLLGRFKLTSDVFELGLETRDLLSQECNQGLFCINLHNRLREQQAT